LLPGSPSLPHPSQKFFFIRAHLPYQRLIAGIFVRGCPEHHLRKNWRQKYLLAIRKLNVNAVCE